MSASALLPLNQVIRTFENLPHCQHLGMRLVLIERGRSVLVVPYDPHLIGNPRTNVVHGGVITSLLDTSCGMAVMTRVPEGTAIATLDLRVDYLRPATPGEEIRGQADCTKVTTNIAFVHAVAYHDHAGNPIAHATGSFILGTARFGPSQDQGRTEPNVSGGQPC
ncbi:MAG: PaaI family thioesterase [Hyphomicrobiales bacterium]|nr:PaaI family thioesterase [Hyphomicrobiales bacterium]